MSVVGKDFTFRELQLIDLICSGLTNKEIATRIKLNEKTVKNYITLIFKKSAVKTRWELMARGQPRLPTSQEAI